MPNYRLRRGFYFTLALIVFIGAAPLTVLAMIFGAAGPEPVSAWTDTAQRFGVLFLVLVALGVLQERRVLHARRNH